MAHPKSRVSKQRKRKRRTHKKAAVPNLVTCQETGERHMPHRAFWLDGNLYYRGQIVVKGEEQEDVFYEE